MTSAGILVWSETKALSEDCEKENEGSAVGMLIYGILKTGIKVRTDWEF